MKPDHAMKKYWYLWTAFIFIICVFSWSVPATFFIPRTSLWVYVLCVHVPAIILLGYVLWWIPKFYDSVEFGIEEDGVSSREGVFWKRVAKLPYKRINMVELKQGPLKRVFNLYNVPIHTAAMGQASTAEITFFDVKSGEAIRASVLERLGELPEEKRKSAEESILEELRDIKRVLTEYRRS